MPARLDPQVADLLPRLNSAFPKLGTEVVDVEEARRQFEALRNPVAAPTKVAEVREIEVAGGRGHRLPARLYRPVSAGSEPREAIVFFHGGGWVMGDLDSHDELVRQLCNSLGHAVVSVAYRLAPEHPFPEPVRDAAAAVRDLSSRAGSLELTAPFVVAGDSAGGNLAALVALEACDVTDLPIAAQVLLYPVLDASRSTPSYRENSHGFYITADHLAWFWEQYLGPAEPTSAPSASPLQRRDLRGAPPALVLTAGLDPLRDEGARYADRLAHAGVDVTLLDYAQAFHGFLGMTADLDIAVRAIHELHPALERLLKGVTANGRSV